MGRSTLAVFTALVLVAATPTEGKRKIPVEEGPDNGFGTVWIEPYPEYVDAPVRVEATVVLKDFGHAQRMEHLMLAFNAHSTSLAVEFVSVADPTGRVLPIEEDQRDAGTSQPKVFVHASELPPLGEPVRLVARVAVGNNGAFHLGVLAIGFDGEWMPMVTGDGFRAEVYGYTLVGSHGQEREPFRAPFEGRGNLVPAPGLLAAVAAIAVASGVRGRLKD